MTQFKTKIKKLEAQLSRAMASDRLAARREIKRLKHPKSKSRSETKLSQDLTRLERRIDASVRRKGLRKNNLPPLNYNDELPITAKKDEIKGKIADDIIQTISSRVSFELPESIVEQESLAIIQRLLSSQQSLSVQKEDVEKIKEEAKKKAEQKLKNHLILTKITEKEKIEIKPEDIEEEIKAIARANNMPFAQVNAQLKKEGHQEEIEDRVRLKKTVDFLIDNAIIKK